MEPRTATIAFRINEEQYDEELNLPAGEYKAEVREVNSTDPVQYQVYDLDCTAACDKKPFEEQLILMRKENSADGWIEAHHNSSSAAVQSIGDAIDKAFS